ncbi:MAG: PEGA domain-containing protein [Myxococcales bacterium]|nr:PEGA domain-containing protein [Myxococcales bacterium]
MRSRSLVVSLVLLAFAGLPAVAMAQMQPRPEWQKGHRMRIKIDSIPQQATIYIDSKAYGVQGYTPSEIKLPKGTYRIILEKEGHKTEEHPIAITRSQPYMFPLVKQARPAILDVRAANDQSAAGGSITVDGTPVGAVPNQVEVSAGTHTLEVKRPGFNDYRDSVQVGEGERRTMVIALVAQVKPGALLVTADVAGADVFVDGSRRDSAPALIGDLPEGDHTVEVKKDGLTPWKQVVRVVAGQQTKVLAQIAPVAPPPPAAGSLRVLSSTPMADVLVDGEPRGPANAELRDLRPGVHVVEVRAAGFVSKRVEAEVRAGEVRAVQIDLQTAAAERQVAGVRVISPVPEAEVFVDGASVGKAPIEKNDLQVGKHFIVVRKEGYAEYRLEADLQAGRVFQVSAVLQATGSLRAISSPPGADVFVDGTAMGKTPISLPDVATGEHVIEAKMKDFVDGKQTLRVVGGQPGVVSFDLVAIQHGPTAAESEKLRREQSTFGALALDRNRFAVDAGVGAFAYFFMARLTAGVWKQGPFGIDAGLELRTGFYQWDIGIRPRVQIYRADPVAVGVDLGFLGGGGPTKRNEFTFELGPMVTFIAGSYVHVTFKPYLAVATERLCPSVSDITTDDMETGMAGIKGSGKLSMMDGGEKPICKTFDDARASAPKTHANTLIFGQMDPRDRFVSARFFLQATLEVAVTESLNVWLLLEGAPFQGQRQGYTSKFNPVYLDEDFPLYGRAGITGKF